MDTNHDDKLSKDEVRRYFNSNAHAEDFHVEEFFNAVDTDRDGYISHQEWSRALNVLQCQQKLDLV